ncbi:MAG: PASTA domain-containing protein, partial [Pyrinomonadaceae bacterium]
EGQYTLKNRCQQRHLFQIQSPPNLPWLQLPGGDRLEISAGQERTINFAIRIDATNVPIGVYRGEIKAPCLDCDREPGCTLGGLFLRVEIKVVAPNGGQDGGQDGGQVTTTVKARKLETVTLAPDDESLSKSGATAERVDSALRWTNNVILAAQPTYAARAVIPRFASPEERSRAFRDARRKAVLSDDPDSQQTLGDVYLDWGEGARSLEAYEKSSQGVSVRQTAPDLLAGKGEALRLIGQLEEAEGALKQAVSMDQQSSFALNALGNVYLDQANVARDKKDTNRARGYLAQARDVYMAASQSPSPTRQGIAGGLRDRGRSPAGSPQNTGAWQAVTRANLGEVYAAYGEIAEEQGRPAEARVQYETAEQTFGEAAKIDPAYPFAINGLGRALRGQGSAALTQGDRERALAAYARSEDQYQRVIAQRRDMAAAYVGLGKVYEETGRTEAAFNSYRRATQTRPEQPEPYYRLAVLLSVGAGTQPDPRAIEYAQTYLKLERDPFKQGEKRATAAVIAGGGSITLPATPTPLPTSSVTPTPIPTPPITTTPTPVPPPVSVPGVRGDRLDAAIREITGLGFNYRLVERPSCDPADRVRDQDPRGDRRAPAGSTITLYVAALEESAVTVPPVEGRQRTDAEKTISESGLNIGSVETLQIDNEPEGKVLDQRPDSGARLRRGCPVRLTVAIPVIRVRVPRFIGRTETDARQRLPRFSGDLLRGSITYRESRLTPGTVIDQDPSPGERVPVGTRVNLVIAGSRQPPPDEEDAGVVVPSVEGLRADEAIKIIRNAGLVPITRAQGEYVTGQDPKAGRRVRRGTRVVLTLAVGSD